MTTITDFIYFFVSREWQHKRSFGMKVISALVSFVIVAPIWYWLLYQILSRVGASELMWFLFWIYVPAALFAGVLVRIADAKSNA